MSLAFRPGLIEGATMLDPQPLSIFDAVFSPMMPEFEKVTRQVLEGSVAGIADRGVEYDPFQARPQGKAVLAFSTLSRLRAFGVTVI